MLYTDSQQHISARHLKSFSTNGGAWNCSILGDYFTRLVKIARSVFVEAFNWEFSTSDLHVNAMFRPGTQGGWNIRTLLVIPTLAWLSC